jgi:hypothetical protein
MQNPDSTKMLSEMLRDSIDFNIFSQKGIERIRDSNLHYRIKMDCNLGLPHPPVEPYIDCGPAVLDIPDRIVHARKHV